MVVNCRKDETENELPEDQGREGLSCVFRYFAQNQRHKCLFSGGLFQLFAIALITATKCNCNVACAPKNPPARRFGRAVGGGCGR